MRARAVVAADALRPSAAAVRAVEEKDTPRASEFELLFVGSGRILRRNEFRSRLDSSAGGASVPLAKKAESDVEVMREFALAVVRLDWRMLLSPASGRVRLFSQGCLKVLGPSPAAKDTGWTEARRQILMEDLLLAGKPKARQEGWWAWRPLAAVVRAATAPNRRRFIFLLLAACF